MLDTGARHGKDVGALSLEPAPRLAAQQPAFQALPLCVLLVLDWLPDGLRKDPRRSGEQIVTLAR
ncbi:hypothetical protein ACIRQF_10570 [Streptomyces sp. NPDC101191]|uniref:hypothetical protein n=1 Tax=Streptomyces sp. NPDC101191 TaxID=3366126 RepID=UPI0038166050